LIDRLLHASQWRLDEAIALMKVQLYPVISPLWLLKIAYHSQWRSGDGP